jgi:hypothetical protein
LLQAVDCEAPLGRRRFAHRVLIAEKADFLDGLLQRHGLPPLDRGEELGFIRIAGELAKVAGRYGSAECGLSADADRRDARFRGGGRGAAPLTRRQ